MNRKVRLYLLIAMFPFYTFGQKKNCSSFSVNGIIPKPVSVNVLQSEDVLINKSTIIYYDEKFADQATYIKEQINDQCGLKLPIQSMPSSNKKSSVIALKYDSMLVHKNEMYLLSIDSNQVVISAKDIPGVVHGVQTFLQLLPLRETKSILIPSVEIVDYPRFEYRGMHLDVSRHFFSIDYIKKYIDYLTFHKFNNFHWHLSDDQGWRIEIKGYPKMTTVGAWRDSTLIGHFRDRPMRYDGKRYGGFYTQEEIREVIKYAAIRGINIIPEIDIPGHSRATIASYPEFSTHPDSTFEVATSPGIYNWKNNVLAPNEKTFLFLKTTFDEIADLFPSPYIHIGGDECSHIWWESDTQTQDFMKKHRIKNETALQTYFMQQVIQYLKLKGKKAIGWDEILEGGVDTSTIIMNWRRIEAAVEAAKTNHHVIMSPNEYTYFNYSQTKNEDSLTQGGYLPLEKVYNFEPTPKGLNEQDKKFILGAQGNVWTEYITNKKKLEYMIFPRMTALSESLWTQKNEKDYTDFKRRIKENAIPRYQFWNSNYFIQ